LNLFVRPQKVSKGSALLSLLTVVREKVSAEMYFNNGLHLFGPNFTRFFRANENRTRNDNSVELEQAFTLYKYSDDLFAEH